MLKWGIRGQGVAHEGSPNGTKWQISWLALWTRLKSKRSQYDWALEVKMWWNYRNISTTRKTEQFVNRMDWGVTHRGWPSWLKSPHLHFTTKSRFSLGKRWTVLDSLILLPKCLNQICQLLMVSGWGVAHRGWQNGSKSSKWLIAWKPLTSCPKARDGHW